MVFGGKMMLEKLRIKFRRAGRGESGASDRWRSGTAALEFALIMPLFALFLMGIFEFGRMFWVQVTLRQAVEQAARVAMAEYTRQTFAVADDAAFTTWFNGWGDTLKTYAATETYAFDPTNIVFSVAKTNAATANGLDTLTVSASYDFDFALIIVPGWTAQTLTAESTTPLVGSNSSYYVPPP